MIISFFTEEVGDERLAVVKELYRTEDAYLEHLKNIFDVYMDPMRYCDVFYDKTVTLHLNKLIVYSISSFVNNMSNCFAIYDIEQCYPTML